MKTEVSDIKKGKKNFKQLDRFFGVITPQKKVSKA